MSALDTLPDAQSSKVGKTEKTKTAVSRGKSPNQRKYVEVRSREYLLPEEVDAMMKAIKKHSGRHSHRDATVVLVLYRHGLRVSEAAGLRWEQVDFIAATLHRLKNGSCAVHPLYGDELRALRKLQKDYPNDYKSNKSRLQAELTISFRYAKLKIKNRVRVSVAVATFVASASRSEAI